MKTNQLPPLPTPKFTETIRGVPCITVTEHEHLMRAYALQARAQVQGEPVCWEWRHLSTHPDTVDFGKWSEWKRVEARSAIHTIEDALAEFRAYIAQGYKYELRALYTPSDA